VALATAQGHYALCVALPAGACGVTTETIHMAAYQKYKDDGESRGLQERYT